MPTISHLGKLYTTMMLKKLHEAVSIRNVVDFGCGEGTYRRLLGPHLPGARWTGIEVWQPYVDQFDLRSQYDSLIVQDCRSVDCLALAPVDLAIFGDILEHMTGDEAASVVERALAVAPLVVISIPVVHFPQGPTGGNPYEAHVKDDWDHYEVMRTFPGVSAFFIHDHIGVYFLTGTKMLSRQVIALQRVVPELVRSRHPDHRMVWGEWHIHSYP